MNPNVEFDFLPAEMKCHVFGYLSPVELSTSRGVSRNWNYLISAEGRFPRKFTVTVCDDRSVDIFLNSYTNWTKVKVIHPYNMFVKPTGPTNDFVAKMITFKEISQRCSILVQITFQNLIYLELSDFTGVIASCANLKSLFIDHVVFKYEEENPQTGILEDWMSSARGVAQKLTNLKLYGIPIQTILVLYDLFLLSVEKLREFTVHERANEPVFLGNGDVVQRASFLDKTRHILNNNCLTLKIFEFSLDNPSGMFQYYRDLFAGLATMTNNQLQLEKLSLYLYGRSQSSQDSHFWEEFEEEFMVFDDDAIPPTELFTMWREFIGTQMNLKSLSLPHIFPELLGQPEHNQALFDLLTSIPPTLKELDASSELVDIPQNALAPVYQNLTTYKITYNLSDYESLIEDNDPGFLALENTEGRLTPKSPHLQKMEAKFWAASVINDPEHLRILRVILRGYPINLKSLSLTLIPGDDGLQLIIQYLPMLQVLKIQCWSRSLSDYGVTGISKSWLTQAVKNLNTFPAMTADKQNLPEGTYVGSSLSQLKDLRVLKIPDLQKFSDIGIYFGLRLPRLKKLCLNTDARHPYNKISDWGLEQLAVNCPALETVRMTLGCLATHEGIRNFTGSLKVLKPLKCVLRRVATHEFAREWKVQAVEKNSY